MRTFQNLVPYINVYYIWKKLQIILHCVEIHEKQKIVKELLIVTSERLCIGIEVLILW